MTGNGDKLFDEIVARHGGIDGLSLTHAAIARALATELGRDTIDPRIVHDLEALLPGTDAAPAHLDLSKLSDDELDALEAMVAKAGTDDAPEQPDQVRELLQNNSELIASNRHLRDQVRIGDAAAEMSARLLDAALLHSHGLEQRLAELEQAAPPAAADPLPPQPPPPSGNVVPLVQPANGTSSWPSALPIAKSNEPW